MLILGLEFLSKQLECGTPNAKIVVNENGAIFFPVSEQHRDQKASGISYEDDYVGNALAAMLNPGRIEIRYHEEFSDQRVAAIFGQLAKRQECEFLSTWEVYYQGRRIRP